MTSTMPTSDYSDMNVPKMGPANPANIPSEMGGDTELTTEQINQLKEKRLHGQLVEFVRGEYAKCKEAHTGFHAQWQMNLAFFKGDQYVEKMRNGTIQERKAPSNRVRQVINRVRPMIRTELSRMTSQEPTAEVVPASTDDDDLMRAEVGQAVYENITRDCHLKERYVEAAFWQAVCGVGYIKTAWNKAGGPDNMGEHVYSAPSPFHVLVPELLTVGIEDQPYVLNVFTKPIEWVKQRYGDKIPKDHKPTVVSTHEIMETQYMNLKGSDRKSEPDACLFIEAWIKPGITELLPMGGLITIVDSFIVSAYMDGIPYQHGEFPFTKFDGVPSGGYYTTSAIEDFMGLQRELNRNRSQRTEARNITSRPQWRAVEGSIDVAKWNNGPGQVLLYKPGMDKPEPMPINQLPTYVVEEEAQILRDMEDVSGQHQVSKGGTPTGVTSGTAISFLQEQDNSFMATVFLSIERGMEKIGKQTLELAVQYWETARLVKAVGRDQTFSVKYFRGTDINGGTDLRIEAGSSLPVSRAARNALFMDLINRGALPVNEGLELMNIPNMRSFFDRVNVDKNQARRENQKMRELDAEQVEQLMAQLEMQKEQLLEELQIVDPKMDPMGAQIEEMYKEPIIPVNEFDNHDAHIAEHEFFMKGQSFESLPEPIREQVIRHRQAHITAKQGDLMAQLMEGGFSELGAVEAPNPQGENQFSGVEESESVDEESAPL